MVSIGAQTASTCCFVRGDVTVVQVYTCCRCGVRKVGSGFLKLFNVTGGTVDEFVQMLEKSTKEPRPGNMPIGWANTTEGFLCMDCVVKEKLCEP